MTIGKGGGHSTTARVRSRSVRRVGACRATPDRPAHSFSRLR